ncbi:MAG TPA: ABC transporter ATP-binding protein [Acidimicrobiales bacterium]|nr:ABC transporter ATP-binding protein [Acidimicrobiales bacterium]
MSNLPALEAGGLTKRYGRTWGLRDCTFSLPAGRIAALVGPNGAGKSTLLLLAAGILRPTEGSVNVFGLDPIAEAAQVLPRIAYLDQERPLYRSFRVEEMLHYGRSLNTYWDDAASREHLSVLNIPLDARVGQLSVGQQAQVALTLCLAKRPELLLLDEPVVALDPLARERLMQVLMRTVAEHGTTVLLSSHAVADLTTVCDYLIVLSGSRVALADDLEYVLASHRLLTGGADAFDAPRGTVLIAASHGTRQHDLLVRVEEPVSDPAWRVSEPTLEEVVLAYMKAGEPKLSAAIANSAKKDGSP